MADRLTREQIVEWVARGWVGRADVCVALADTALSLMDENERLLAVVEFLAKPRGRMAAHVHYDEAVQMARAALTEEGQ